jgi:aldehyde:ferredoxin oxidoreductase
MEFEQIVNPKGSHVASGGSPTYVGASYSIDKFKSHFNRMGIPDSAFKQLFNPVIEEMKVNVGRLTRYSEDWYTILSSMGICARAQMNRFYSLDLATEFYNVVTGLDFPKEKIRIAAERSWNLLKLMNVKEGFSRQDDAFPKTWFTPLKFGEKVKNLHLKSFFGDIKITPEIANKMLDSYYDERGWNKLNGTPSEAKLKELELEGYC